MAWTDERRRKQAEAIRRWRPWERSTGPITEQGKLASSTNSLKHGATTKTVMDAMRELRQMDRQTREVLNTIETLILK